MAPFDARQSEDASLSLTAAVIQASPGPLLLLDGNLVIIDASRSFCEAFEIDLAEMRGATLTQLGSGEWRRPRLQELLVATASDSSGKGACEVELRRPGRSDRQLIVHAERLAYHDLPEIRIMVAISDVTQLRADQQAVAETHERHRVLLHEVRHRVANSLQIVASILLQDARKAHSEEAKSSLADAHNRVMSIAALERQLTDLTADGVEVRTYFTTLCTSISASMVGDRERIAILVTGPGGVVDARLSLSLGLIVTELVINALKHAFPNERHGAITIECAFPGPNWVLAVADNGVGVPTDQRDTRVGLGTSIVNALVRQVGATVSVEAASPGTRVSISRTAIALVDETRISDVSADRSIA